MKKKLLCLVMSLVIAMGLATVVSFAGTGDGNDGETITPYSTASVSFTTRRYSSTSAGADSLVSFTAHADSYVVTVTLQKQSGGSWVTASDISGYSHVYRGYNSSSCLTSDSWTVKSGMVYRLKVTSVDNYPLNSYNRTTYSDPF